MSPKVSLFFGSITYCIVIICIFIKRIKKKNRSWSSMWKKQLRRSRNRKSWVVLRVHAWVLSNNPQDIGRRKYSGQRMVICIWFTREVESIPPNLTVDWMRADPRPIGTREEVLFEYRLHPPTSLSRLAGVRLVPKMYGHTCLAGPIPPKPIEWG